MNNLLQGESSKFDVHLCSRLRRAFLQSNSRSARGVNQTLLRVAQNRSRAARRACRVLSSIFHRLLEIRDVFSASQASGDDRFRLRGGTA
jgi:hypothetical protein